MLDDRKVESGISKKVIWTGVDAGLFTQIKSIAQKANQQYIHVHTALAIADKAINSISSAINKAGNFISLYFGE
jgi:hypothetical protein